MKKNTMNYTAPEVELVEVAVECGVYLSSGDSDILLAGEEDYGEF